MVALTAAFLFVAVLYKNRLTRLQRQEAEHILKAAIESEKRERERIAADLHDGVSGDLAAIRNYLLLLERSTFSRELAEEALSQIKIGVESALENTRQISYRLMPPLLRKSGLNAALRDYFERLSFQSGIRFIWETSNDPQIVEDTAYELFRVIQELTTNMIKHGKISECRGTISFNGSCEIVLQDDGLAFDFVKSQKKKNGNGLYNIATRLKAIKAQFTFERRDARNFYTIRFVC